MRTFMNLLLLLFFTCLLSAACSESSGDRPDTDGDVIEQEDIPDQEEDASPDPCKDIFCGEHAFCINGYCICDMGYEGDPHEGCSPEIDPCKNVTCGYNAYCLDGVCICKEGYEGEPTERCAPINYCEYVVCGENAYCLDGECICEEGYGGNADYGCTPIRSLCDDIVCNENAHCEQGFCVCDDGYEGHPAMGCVDENPCRHITCGENAECLDGKCYCTNGYVGVPDIACRGVSDCSELVCAANAYCEGGLCHCKEHYENYNPAMGCEVIDYCERFDVDCRAEYSEHSHCKADPSIEQRYRCVCNHTFEYSYESDACELVCADDAYENNDRLNGFDAVLIDQFPYRNDALTSYAAADGISDNDVFLLHLDQGDILVVETKSSLDEGDVQIALSSVNEPEIPIETGDYEREGKRIEFIVEKAGFYLIQVFNKGIKDTDDFPSSWITGHFPACTNYSLEVTLLENPCMGDAAFCEDENEVCTPDFVEDFEVDSRCDCPLGFDHNVDTGACEQVCPPDDHEPNNEAYEATPIDSLPFQSENSTNHILFADADWFRFYTPGRSLINIETYFNDYLGSMHIDLYEYPSLNFIEEREVLGNDYKAIQYFTESGGIFMVDFWFSDYYLPDYDYYSACNHYDFKINSRIIPDPCLRANPPCGGDSGECVFRPYQEPAFECKCALGFEWNDETQACEVLCADDDFEPNDTFATASRIETNPFSRQDLVAFGDENDYYAIELDAGDFLSVSAEYLRDSPDAVQNLELFLYSARDIDAPLFSSTDYSDYHEINAIVPHRGQYYIRVWDYFDWVACSRYALNVYSAENPCIARCGGSHMTCELISVFPHYQCVCNDGYLYWEDREACFVDPCLEANCESDMGEHSVCKAIFEGETPDEYECLCEDGYALSGQGDDRECRLVECIHDAYEDNDDRDTAFETALPLRAVDLVVGESDEDWFSFTLEEGMLLTATAIFSSFTGDIDIKLFYGLDSPWAVATSDGNDDNERIEYGVVEGLGGTYYLKVYNLREEQCTDYELHLTTRYDPCVGHCLGPNIHCNPSEDYTMYECECDRGYVFNQEGDACIEDPCRNATNCIETFSENSHCEPDWPDENRYVCVCDDGFVFDEEAMRCVFLCEDDTFEENDTSDDAFVVSIPFQASGLILRNANYREADADWFVFSVQRGERLQVEATFSHALGDVELFLYEANREGGAGEEAARAISSSDNETLSYEVTKTDDYFLRLRVNGSRKCTPYGLTISLE